jgi:hypothetical protein
MNSVNWSAITDLGQLPAQANTVSGGAFWVSILWMLWVVILLAAMGWGFETALALSSFIALALSIFLVYSQLIAWQWAMTFAAILLFAFLYIAWTTRQHNN